MSATQFDILNEIAGKVGRILQFLVTSQPVKYSSEGHSYAFGSSAPALTASGKRTKFFVFNDTDASITFTAVTHRGGAISVIIPTSAYQEDSLVNDYIVSASWVYTGSAGTTGTVTINLFGESNIK